jgi:signal transduction histidine kinase
MGHDFDTMTARIESLVKAQRRLLGDISHELRSPLARLGVALELARRRAGPGADVALDRIGREAESINEMIGQLLTLSRVENATDLLNKEKIDLCALVRDVADDADFEARSRALRLARLARRAAWRGCSGAPSRMLCATPCVTRLKGLLLKSRSSARELTAKSAPSLLFETTERACRRKPSRKSFAPSIESKRRVTAKQEERASA